MRFALLGSGSQGNATLIEAGGTRLLVDCGFNLRDTEARLAGLGIEAAQLDAVLVTHEHTDHLSGVARLARRHHLPVYLTHGTHAAWNDPKVPAALHFSPHTGFPIGAIQVQPYPVPHDAREPCQYVLSHRGLRLGILSDAGHITAHMRAVLDGCDALLLECNHDPHMLANGPYHRALKARVGGHRGHLANAQSAELLRQLDLSRLQQLVLTHLSETNNSPELALSAVYEALQDRPGWVSCAGQRDGSGWRTLSG